MLGIYEVNRVYVGDCATLMQNLPNGVFQTCVTSPPYWGLRDYGIEPRVWGGDVACKHEWGSSIVKKGVTGGKNNPFAEKLKIKGIENYQETPDSSSQFCLHCGAWRGSLGLEPTPEFYVQHLVEISREVKRVLRDDGTLWLNLGHTYWGGKGQSGRLDHNLEERREEGRCIQRREWTIDTKKVPQDGKHPVFKPKDIVPIPWMVAMALQADGWWLRSDIIWAKSNPMPESVRDRPTKSHEYLFLLAKSKRYYYDADAIREPHSEATKERVKYPHADWEGNQPNSSWVTTKDNPARKIVQLNPAGRNCRTVWTIPTKPFREAHFATFPPALVEPCIKAGTSEKGQCPKCGKAWMRVREPSRDYAKLLGKGYHNHSHDLSQGMSQEKVMPRVVADYHTIGWQPTCDCRPFATDSELVIDGYGQLQLPPVPQIVLDPFSGAGTTCMVADRLKRHWIGIDISEEYCEMARERIRKDRLGGKIPDGQTTIFDTLPFPV